MKTPNMPMTNALREAIAKYGKPMLTLEQESGVQRGSIARFMAGERTLRLDMADRLAAFFGIECRPARRRKG